MIWELLFMVSFIFWVCVYFWVVFLFAWFEVWWVYWVSNDFFGVGNLSWFLYSFSGLIYLFVVLVFFISLIFGDLGIYTVDFYSQFFYMGSNVFLSFSSLDWGFWCC